MSTYYQRVKEIYAAQSFKEFYSRIFSGKFSPFIAAACCNTGITPNHLTASMIPTGIIGGLVLCIGNDLGFLIGGLLFVLLNILDAADGELARYTGQTSDFGDYLDRIAHYMTNTSLIIGMGFGLYVYSGHYYLIPLTFFANAAIIGDDALRDLLVSCGLQRTTGGSDQRKYLKSKTKISFGKLGSVVNTLSSNIAIFHISTILAIMQLKLVDLPLLESYFVFFSCATIIKFILRARKIMTTYV